MTNHASGAAESTYSDWPDDERCPDDAVDEPSIDAHRANLVELLVYFDVVRLGLRELEPLVLEAVERALVARDAALDAYAVFYDLCTLAEDVARAYGAEKGGYA